MEVEKGIAITRKHESGASQSETEKTSVQPVIDHVAERRLLRKMDLRIMPLIMSLYLFVSNVHLASSLSKDH